MKDQTKNETKMSYEVRLRNLQEEERKKEAEREKRKNKTGRTPAQFAGEIRRLIVKTKDEDDPEGARTSRAVLVVFLRELMTHMTRHREELDALVAALSHKRVPVSCSERQAMMLAQTAIRHNVVFGRRVARRP